MWVRPSIIFGRRRSAALPQFGRADLRVRPNILPTFNHTQIVMGALHDIARYCTLGLLSGRPSA